MKTYQKETIIGHLNAVLDDCNGPITGFLIQIHSDDQIKSVYHEGNLLGNALTEQAMPLVSKGWQDPKL